MDDNCTQMVFLNDKCRVLELYALKWAFDLTKIDKKLYDRLEDDTLAEELGISNSR